MTLFFAERAGTYLTIDALLAFLDDGLTKYAGNPVLPFGAGGQWDDAQTRELRPVIDEDGLVVTEADGIWAYYGGYPDITLTGSPQIGLAKSVDGGITWTRYGSNPVVTNGGGSWRNHGVVQPSAVKKDDGTRVMMAQGFSSAASTASTIGCFTSADGLTWVDQGQKITLSGLVEGGTAFLEMGVPSLIKRASGDWLCLFEALKDPGTGGLWRIFGATASDPTGTWTVMNSNQPLMTAGSGWESVGVANPSVIEVTPGLYAMTYNGWQTFWRLGFAYSTNLTTWTRYSGNPILTVGTAGAWDDQHIESCFLFKEPSAANLRVLFHGFEASAAQIGYAST